MESIREIVVPQNNKIEISIPDNFIGERIEVIALRMEDASIQRKKIKQPFIVADVKIKDYKFNRDEASQR